MLQLFEEQSVGSVAKPAKFRSAVWSALIHLTVLAFLLSLGLSPAFRSLPDNLSHVLLVAPPPPPPPPPPPLRGGAKFATRQPVRVFNATLTAPAAIPKEVAIIDAGLEALPEIGVPGGVPGGIPGGVLGGVLGGSLHTLPAVIEAPPPPPIEAKAPPPPPPPAPKRIQVSAEIQEAKLLTMVRPEYPLAAKLARVQGAVKLRAIISCEGQITDLEIVEGHPLLTKAAQAAVEKWRYRPTFLDGTAVVVATEIIVNFRLT